MRTHGCEMEIYGDDKRNETQFLGPRLSTYSISETVWGICIGSVSVSEYREFNYGKGIQLYKTVSLA